MKFQSISNKITNLALIALLTLALVNCNQPINDTTQFDLEKAKSEISSRLRAYEDAMANGDKIVFGNMYAEDAEIFHDGSPSTIGRQTLLKFLKAGSEIVLLAVSALRICGETKTC